MGSKAQKIEIVRYFMSIHFGIALGPIDSIRAILIKEKEAWKGNVSDYTVINVSKPDLFGGSKKEGGIEGDIYYLPGNAAQVIPEFLAKKLGLTSATCPAYRGWSTAWFTAPADAAAAGFYWSANQPTIPPTWIIGSRAPKGLAQQYAMLPDRDGDLVDANVVHVIYEVMTNTDWGLGTPANLFNTPLWEAAAKTIFDEGIGVSMLWTEQTAGEDFVSRLLGYIDACVYVNPANGLLEIKLARNDYDENTLFELTPDNSKFSDYQRKLFGETINEVVVSWTNPKNEKAETVSWQDPANIAIQGGIVSDTRDYAGIRRSDIAKKLCVRDLRVAAAPLCSLKAMVNREGFDQVPGGVVRVTNPRDGMNKVVMRITEIDYGKIGDSRISLSLAEDIFAFDASDYVDPPPSQWIDTREDPAPLQHVLPFTLPYYMARRMASSAQISDPGVVVGVLGATDSRDTQEFILAERQTDAAGDMQTVLGTSLSITSMAFILQTLPFAVVSTVQIGNLTAGDRPRKGFIAILGHDDASMEICIITNVADDMITMKRGMMDTTPKAWPQDTKIWFVDGDAVIDDEEIRTAGDQITFRPLSVTSKGRLTYASADDVTFEVQLRPWLPTRPANVKANGQATGGISLSLGQTLTLTWNNRNRLMEDSVLLDWDDAGVTPETGQTTSVIALDPDTGAEIARFSDITDQSFVVPVASIPATDFFLRVVATNDGDDSFQGHEFLIHASGSGFGYTYGQGYGN